MPPKSARSLPKSTQSSHLGLSGSGRTRRPFGFKFSGSLQGVEGKLPAKFQVYTTSGRLRIGRERVSARYFSNFFSGVLRRMCGVKFGLARLW